MPADVTYPKCGADLYGLLQWCGSVPWAIANTYNKRLVRSNAMTDVKAQEKFVTVNNLRLRYFDWGSKGMPPMVCLHGHTGQAHIWDEFAELMSSQYHVYALDQRGHGGSQWSSNGYDRDRFVEDLSDFLDTLSLGRVTLVGLSMGGWNSLLYTPSHPERVERIILVDIGPEPNEQSRQGRSNRLPTPMEFGNMEQAFAWARQTNPWVTDSRLRRDLADRMRQQDNGGWTWKADPVLYTTPLSDMEDPESIARYWRSLEAITCPILEVRGKESPTVSDETLERMARANPRFRHIDVEGAGHVVTVDKPQEFIAATSSFLGLMV